MEPSVLTHTCVSCNTTFTGKFCSNCGEKVISDQERSLTHFFGEFVHLLTHADSKFLRSITYLFTRPGFLTQQVIMGKRKLYTSPLSLFLIGNLIYFLLSPVDALNTGYQSQIYAQPPYSSLAFAMAQKKIAARHEDPVQFEKEYNHASTKVSKLILIVLAFLFSLPVSLLFYKRANYYYDHLMFSVEFISFIVYGVFFAIPWLLFITMAITGKVFGFNPGIDINGFPVVVTTMGLLFAYLLLASRRVYRQNWVVTSLKSIALVFSTAVVIFAYRFILFCITLWVI